MASLTGQQINNTYQSLLKTTGNTALPATGKVTMTDGAGNASPLSLSQTQLGINTGASGQLEIAGDNITLTDSSVSTGFAITGTQMDFAGSIDFSGATVTGLPGGGGLTAYTMTTPILIPATASDVNVYSFVIPGGTFGAGDVLLFKSLCGSQSGNNYFQFWVGASAGVYTTDPLAVAGSNKPSVGFEKSIYIESATSSRWFDENFASDAQGDNSGFYSLVNSTVNWNNDVYINFQGYADPGNVAYFYGASLTKIN